MTRRLSRAKQAAFEATVNDTMQELDALYVDDHAWNNQERLDKARLLNRAIGTALKGLGIMLAQAALPLSAEFDGHRVTMGASPRAGNSKQPSKKKRSKKSSHR